MKTMEQDGPGVVVIEESSNDLYSVKFVLQSLGYDVESVGYDSDIFGRLVEASPRLVLVDLLIPNRGGLHVIHALRKFSKDLLVIAILAPALEIEEEDVVKAGANKVLQKPYSVSDLQSLLQELLQEDS